MLYSYAKRLLSVKTAAVQALQELQGGVSGELLIGGSSIPGQYVLPPILGHFKRQYPDITVCLSITDTMDTIERIIRGDLELGVVGACVQHAQVLYDRFVEDELVLAVAHDHPWGERDRAAHGARHRLSNASAVQAPGHGTDVEATASSPRPYAPWPGQASVKQA